MCLHAYFDGYIWHIYFPLAGMPTPSGSSESSIINKKLSGQLAQMSNSTTASSGDGNMISNNSSASKKFSSETRSSSQMSNTNSQGNVVNTNMYNAQYHQDGEQHQHIQAKKRSQQSEQK